MIRKVAVPVFPFLDFVNLTMGKLFSDKFSMNSILTDIKNEKAN